MTVKQLQGLMCHSSRHLSSVYLEPLHVTSFHQPLHFVITNWRGKVLGTRPQVNMFVMNAT